MYSNSKYLLWSGVGTLRSRNVHATLNCRVYQESGGKYDLVIEGEDPFGRLPLLIPADDIQLEIQGIRGPLDVMVSQHSCNSQGHSSLSLRPLRTPCWFSKSRPLQSGRFVIVNFAHYWMGAPANLNFTLRAGGWTAQFIACTEKSLEIPGVQGNDEFRVTHQVEFSRDDGSLFTEQEAQEFLSKLVLFLSFCRGQWVGLSLAVGLDENGEMALEQWGTGRVSVWRTPSGWLDEHHGNCIGEIYEEFFRRLTDGAWFDAVSHVVYWFARADTNNVGPDGACILLQAALERLAWHVLVRERNAISEKGFRDLTAADQLRLLLNILSIPMTIPNSLPGLHALRRSLGRPKGLDGPEIFTFIRNRLTHPPKLSAPKEELPYYEAYCLAQSYVELAILSMCGYTGEYGNRTILRRWRGEVQKVPWA